MVIQQHLRSVKMKPSLRKRFTSDLFEADEYALEHATKRGIPLSRLRPAV